MSWAKILVSAGVLAGALAGSAGFRALFPKQCNAPTRADKERLINFVRLKYNLPASAEIGMAEGGPVSGSCFRELVFATLKGAAFRAEFFASPDFRFLAREILDARPDPRSLAERRRHTAEALAGTNVPAGGAENAPVTLAVFSDFQCPFCARLANSINRLPASERDRLHILYHYFSLSMHKWARSAAEAAACAQRQSGAAFWSLHDYLFANQKDLSAGNLRNRLLEWARSARIDQTEFETCVNRSLTSGQIEQDIALGNELGVAGTPAVFLNGDPVNDTSPDKLAELIARASAKRP